MSSCHVGSWFVVFCSHMSPCSLEYIIIHITKGQHGPLTDQAMKGPGYERWGCGSYTVLTALSSHYDLGLIISHRMRPEIPLPDADHIPGKGL